MSDHFDPHPHHRRRRSRRPVPLLLVTLVVLAAGATVAWRVLGEDGPDRRTVALDAFFSAWSSGDIDQAARQTTEPRVAQARLARLREDLPVPVSFEHGAPEGSTGSYRFRTTYDLQGDRWSFESSATVVEQEGETRVRWSSALMHPRLTDGSKLALREGTSQRGEILAADGRPLDGLAPALVGSPGSGGLEYRYDDHLRGRPVQTVAIVGTSTGRVLATLHSGEGRPGQNVTTTLDRGVQQAAEQALGGVGKNAALVAIRPSTGEILAAADNPRTGQNRSLLGRYPPGSDFKVVTAAALLETGLTIETPMPCPRYETVAGQRFENQDLFKLPAGSTFGDDFAHSCNTGLIAQRERLGATALRDTAAAFGIGAEWNVGAVTFDGSVPANTSDNDKAAAMIGQGRVEASPLVMASVAATVKDGTFRQPVLVPSAVKRRATAPRALKPGVADSLRTMMRSVVTEGSGGALRQIPGQPGAKTGTAEFGTQTPPRTHVWFIGYREDLSFAVLLEDGGSGGADAGPVAARFLRAAGTP
ncbi:penicillin-binding transpeptidase domain-containing protein [Streptomyces roseolus]|uniref:penicillin-binding transpeptidase domain-containing protein n=2 Tax=Streptomyces TaxID=1883 RepID=UPI00362FAFF2